MEHSPAEEFQSLEEQRVYPFEEFVRRLNNFWLYFGGGMGTQYREDEWYRRFATENVELERKLRSSIEEELVKNDLLNRDYLERVQGAVRSVMGELYEAYKIMKSYGIHNIDLNLNTRDPRLT